jgi:hypothetical protein
MLATHLCPQQEVGAGMVLCTLSRQWGEEKLLSAVGTMLDKLHLSQCTLGHIGLAQ